jgi:hypothetical protein
MKGLWLSLTFLLLVGCSDVVTSHYKTYSEAAKDQLFGRGWLPDFIPSSSTNITTSNNLDLNRSEGEFSFPPAATNSFVSRLVPYSGRDSPSSDFDKVVNKRKAQDYTLYEFTETENRWVFFLNREKGHAYYNMKPELGSENNFNIEAARKYPVEGGATRVAGKGAPISNFTLTSIHQFRDSIDAFAFPSLR